MIRSIIYLDEPKLYSLSSQVLEGLTEYLLQETSETNEQAESQKGPVASGRMLADAMKATVTSVERKVLHDHAFTVFEQSLINSGNILDIGRESVAEDNRSKVDGASFVRVNAPATFIDAAKLSALFRRFNELGEALTRTSKQEEIQAAVKKFEQLKATVKDKSKRTQLERQYKVLTDPVVLAKDSGLYQDPKFLESLAMLTEFGYSDQLEIQQSVSGLIYSACLKRECLREAEDLVIRKYSRKTEKDLVVLGVITQTAQAPDTSTQPADWQPANMKQALTNMIDHIALIETHLAGKSIDEVVVDPIAVYVSLD